MFLTFELEAKNSLTLLMSRLCSPCHPFCFYTFLKPPRTISVNPGYFFLLLVKHAVLKVEKPKWELLRDAGIACGCLNHSTTALVPTISLFFRIFTMLYIDYHHLIHDNFTNLFPSTIPYWLAATPPSFWLLICCYALIHIMKLYFWYHFVFNLFHWLCSQS